MTIKYRLYSSCGTLYISDRLKSFSDGLFTRMFLRHVVFSRLFLYHDVCGGHCFCHVKVISVTFKYTHCTFFFAQTHNL